jgi:hypothetical protein
VTGLYKFLDPGAVGRFSGYPWPESGEWVATEGRLDPCRNGIHACRAADLPHWIGAELWQVELGGEVLEYGDVVVAQRGRLVRRVEGWTAEVAAEFAAACAENVRGHDGSGAAGGYADDAATYAAAARESGAPEAAFMAAIAAYVAARASSAAAERDPGDEAGYAAFREGRRWQAAWLVDKLSL